MTKSTSGGPFLGIGVKGGSAGFTTAYNNRSETHVQIKITAHTGGGTVTDITCVGTITATFTNDANNFQVQYDAAENGTYTVSAPYGNEGAYVNVTPGTATRYTTYSGDALSLSATPVDGYNFIRFYTIDKDGNLKTLGKPFDANQTVSISNLTQTSGNVNVCAEFSQAPFAIGERTYYTLDAALQAVKSSSNKVIRVIKNASVTAGNYTIPTGVTLLVPKTLDQIDPSTALARQDAVVTPTCTYMLTLEPGVNIQVYGNIEVGGTQSPSSQGKNGTGIPTGPYGQIEMSENSSITLNNGAKLYAWGFVTGSGEIDARRGSKVYEMFQMYDWKGGSMAAGMIDNSSRVFPVTQYFIQNVEAATTYHPGAELIGCASIKIDVFTINSNVVKIIGSLNSGAMFLMDEADPSEDTWVKKSYNPTTDQQVYKVNSSASLGSMVIEFDVSGFSLAIRTAIAVAIGHTGNIKFDSRKYDLPVTNNMKIHLLTGEMDITQNTVLLPGAEIEIDKTATVSIISGKALYLYDEAQWGKYVYSDAYAQPVLYSPSAPLKNGRHTPEKRAGSWVNSGGWWYVLDKPASAAMNVHGTFDVKGALYTTEGGANVYSSIADAGTIKFTVAAGANKNVYQWQNVENNNYVPAACTSAKLKNDKESAYSNGDGYSETAGTAAGKSWCFIDIDNDLKGEWVRLATDGCFVLDEETGIYYAKPSDYVALQNGKTPNADHTYSSVDGSRTFILICDDKQTDCQWWQVTYHEESGLYYCAKNGIYYFFDEDIDLWVEKRYTITWLDHEGNVLKDEYNNDITYLVPYGSMPKYNNSTPSRQDDPGYYTYDFVRWSPDFTPVTSDVSYTAVYERNPVMYTITWQNANGTEREVDYFQRDEMPVCRTQPADMSALEWRPAVAAVTGNATYRLYPKDNVGPYDIKFVNWNGAQIGATQSVAKGSMPNVPADPTKPALDDVEFIFAGWSPEVVAATAAATYTATFTEQPITYTILWKNYNDALLETDENVTPNTVPQYNGATPTKPSDDTYHYTFSGWDQEIVAATEDAIYTATYAATPKDKSVSTAETIDGGTQQTVTNLTITSTGTLTIPSTSRINAENLYLEATSDASGQIITNANTSINITGNVYFDLILNTPARHWHAFGVPWAIGNLDDVKLIADGQPMTLGRDYEIVYYNGATRASQGAGAHCWEYVVDHGKTLTPGQGYMIAFGRAVYTVRFTKAADSPVLFNGFLSVAENGGGETANNGWNAIANPMAFHVTMNAGPTTGYVHDGGVIGSDGYVPYDINDKKYVVGKMVYVQVGGSQSVVINPAGDKGAITPASAPVRRSQAAYKQYLALDDYYQIGIADPNAQGGRVYVLPEEDKADEYVIGHDLSHLGISDQKAQIWVFRYGTKLALNTTAPVEGVAEYALRVYTPKNGEYTISNIQAPMADEEYVVYLTRDGEAIWNLSESAYTADLTSGVHKEYGLRLSARKSPTVVTGVDEAVVDAKGETRKVLINNQVFIIRGNEVYTIDGQLVK